MLCSFQVLWCPGLLPSFYLRQQMLLLSSRFLLSTRLQLTDRGADQLKSQSTPSSTAAHTHSQGFRLSTTNNSTSGTSRLLPAVLTARDQRPWTMASLRQTSAVIVAFSALIAQPSPLEMPRCVTRRPLSPARLESSPSNTDPRRCRTAASFATSLISTAGTSASGA